MIRPFPALFTAERISERTVEQLVDMPVLQILEEVVEVVKAGSAVNLVPPERISERIFEQIVDAPVPHAVDELVPQFQEETAEVTQLSPPKRMSERTQIVDVPVPQILEEPVVPQFQEETVEVIQLSPLALTSVDEASESKVCTTRNMQLVQRKTRAERQGKHNALVKLEKELATAVANRGRDREGQRDTKHRHFQVACRFLHPQNKLAQRLDSLVRVSRPVEKVLEMAASGAHARQALVTEPSGARLFNRFWVES